GFIGNEEHHDEIVALADGIFLIAIKDASPLGGFPTARRIEPAQRLAAEKHRKIGVALENVVRCRFDHSTGVTPLSKGGVCEDRADAVAVKLRAGEIDHPLIHRGMAYEHVFVGENETDRRLLTGRVIPTHIGFPVEEWPLDSLVRNDLPCEFSWHFV